MVFVEFVFLFVYSNFWCTETTVSRMSGQAFYWPLTSYRLRTWTSRSRSRLNISIQNVNWVRWILQELAVFPLKR